jgi:hypothetical protein
MMLFLVVLFQISFVLSVPTTGCEIIKSQNLKHPLVKCSEYDSKSSFPPGVVSSGSFEDKIETTGWSILEIQTNGSFSDEYS